MNEEFGKDCQSKGNSVKRSGPFNEPPDSEIEVALLIPRKSALMTLSFFQEETSKEKKISAEVEGGTVFDDSFDLSRVDAQEVVFRTCEKLRELRCTEKACKNNGYELSVPKTLRIFSARLPLA